MDKNKYAALSLENQLCFPLYACARDVIRKYTPLLNELDLTYTQYIAMIVLWESGAMTVKDLGERLYLDSGTLTPMLKKLELKGLLSRTRSREDERSLIVSLTEQGAALREQALSIPVRMAPYCHLSPEEAAELHRLLYKLLDDN